LREAIAATDAEVARSQYSLESALKITSQLEAKLNIAHTDGTALQKKMSVTDAEWADLEVQLGAAVAELGTLRATLSTLRSSALSNEIFWPLQRHAIHESDVTVSRPKMQIDNRASLLGSNRAVHNLTSTESDRGGLRDKLSVVELERDTAVRELEKTRQQMTCTKETIAQIRVEAKREIQAAKKHERDKEAELNAKLREADEYGSFLNSCCVM
jgi:chromosome segregation ATPase